MRLMAMHEEQQEQPPFSQLPVGIDEPQPKTKKSEVGVNIKKTRFPLTMTRALVIVGTVLGLAAVAISIYTLVAIKTTTTSITSTIPTLRWNSTAITVAGTGAYGTTNNQLSTPMAVALDSLNTLYIADLNNSRVQKCAPTAPICITVAGQANAAAGSSNTSLNQAGGLVIDSSDSVYIVDIYNCRIQYWPDGASSGTTTFGTGGCGTSINQLNYPFSMTRDPSSGTLYIADTNNHRVISYLPGSSSGTVVAGGHGVGLNNTQLNYPIGLYFDSSSNSLVIANAGANNIIRWVLNTNSWTLVAGDLGGAIGTTSTMFHYPVAVTFDSWTNMYVADTYNHRIQFFSAGGSSGTTIAGVVATIGSNATLLNYPYGVTLDADLSLYVADGMNHRVQKFVRY